MVCTVSVVIPTKNEEENIERCLAAIKRQTVSPYEYIVVDNGSTDKTVEIAKKNGAKTFVYPKVKIGELRNKGAAQARGDILAFLDADCEPYENWLENAVKSLFEGSGVGIVGRNVLPSSDNWVETVWFFNIDRKPGIVRYIGSANLIITKDTFDKVKGFSSELIAGEDEDLSRKVANLGLKILQDDKIKVIHHGYPRNMVQFFKRELWHGKSISNDFGSLLKSRLLLLLSVMLLASFCVIVAFFLKEFVFALILSVLLAIIPVFIALKKCLMKKQYRYFIKLSALYSIYLLARMIALIIVVAKMICCNTSLLSHE